MADDAGSGVGGARKLLEDLVTPSLGRLEERVASMAKQLESLSVEIERNREEIKGLWRYVGNEIGSLREAVGRAEGRVEGAREEIAARVKLHLMEQMQALDRGSKPPELSE